MKRKPLTKARNKFAQYLTKARNKLAQYLKINDTFAGGDANNYVLNCMYNDPKNRESCTIFNYFSNCYHGTKLPNRLVGF